MNKDKEDFRNWMRKTYGRQDANDYAGTFTEDIAIRYAQEKQKLNIHNVMQAEGSDVSEGAAVGQRSVGKSVCDGHCEEESTLIDGQYQCNKCKWWHI